MPKKQKRILAVTSGGGHWVQLRRLMPSFEGLDLVLATVHADYVADAPPEARFHTIRDATRWDRWNLIVVAFQLLWLIISERPDIVLSTGAAPGYLALRIAKFFGAKTIWIDSIANVDAVSLSGQKIGPHCDVWLTQWEHLAKPDGPRYIGAVL